jgi:16S rRNA (uracil1498-N3)-methyltransferase
MSSNPLRCYLPGGAQGLPLPAEVFLPSEETHHLGRVLRAQPGAALVFFDGVGGQWTGQLLDATRGRVLLAAEVLPRSGHRALGSRLVLGQALLKAKAMDEAIKQATALGVSQLQPLVTSHSEAQWDAKGFKHKQDKWHRLAVAACKQSGNLLVPDFLPPVDIRGWTTGLPERALRLVCSLEAGATTLLECLQTQSQPALPVVVAIGPEGDFSQHEYAHLRTAGFHPVSLCQQVLRAEVAVMYALSVLDAFEQSQPRL